MRRIRTSKNHAWSLFLLGIIVLWPLCAHSGLKLWPIRSKTRLTPVRVGGSVNLDYMNKMVKDKKAVSDYKLSTSLSMGKGARGFLWKPWILQWNGTLGIGATSSQNVPITHEESEGNTDALSRNLFGNFDLSVFPQSRFPFKILYKRDLADFTEGLSGGQGDFRETMSLSQNYRNKEQDTQVALNFDHKKSHSGIKNISGIFGISIPTLSQYDTNAGSDALSLSVDKRLANHAFRFLGALNRSDELSGGSMGTLINSTLILNHSLEGSQNWSLNNMGNLSETYNRTAGSGPFGTNDQKALATAQQISSFGYWRSDDKPLAFSASARVSQSRDISTIQQNRTGDVDNQDFRAHSMNFSLGGNFDPSPTISLSGTFTANHLHQQLEGENTASEDASADFQITYSPESHPWPSTEFTHTWFLSGSLKNHIANGSSPGQQLSERVGQGLTRRIFFNNNMMLGLSLNQTGSGSQTNSGYPTWNISHSVSGRLKHRQDTQNNLFELNLNDSRIFGPEKSDSQIANLQLSSEDRSNSGFSWQGHITSQWSRQAAGGISGINRSSNANLSIQKPNLFDLPQLRFVSLLSFGVGGKLLPLGTIMGMPGESEQQSWWNVIDYRIGKISTRLTASLSETSARESGFEREGLIQLEIKRYFGSTY